MRVSVRKRVFFFYLPSPSPSPGGPSVCLVVCARGTREKYFTLPPPPSNAPREDRGPTADFVIFAMSLFTNGRTIMEFEQNGVYCPLNTLSARTVNIRTSYRYTTIL